MAALSGAATVGEPITGAFGLEFSEPVGHDVLGASLEEAPYPLPPGDLPADSPPTVPGERTGWYLFTPRARPERLEDASVRFYLLRDDDGHPVRILAEHPQPACAEDLDWFTSALGRKYGTREDPYGAKRRGFRHSARFVDGSRQIDVSCGPSLLLEYTDGGRYRRWLEARQAARRTNRERRAALTEQAERLREIRLRRFADSFTAGDRFRVEGALGITFGEPVDATLLESEFEADAPLPARLPDLAEPFTGASFTLTLGPERRPVRVAGELADPGGQLFERVSAALRTKFGAPVKDGDVHRIHKVSGDYLVVRRLPDEQRLRLVFIDDAGRRAQQAREVAAHEARLAEQRRRFEEETAGL